MNINYGPLEGALMRPLLAFAIIILFFTGGALFMIQRDHEVAAVPILNPTQFAQPKDLGVALARRFYNELQMKRAFIFGRSSYVDSQNEIWQAFIGEAEKQGVGFQSEVQSVEQAVAHQRGGERIYMFLDSNLENRKLIENSKLLKFVIFLSPVVPNKNLVEKLPFQCVTTDSQDSVPCLALKVSHAYYRRPLSLEHFGAIMEKYSMDFGMLYVWEPH